MKYWAYYESNGIFIKIGARQVIENESTEPGLWKSKVYYSTHPPDRRLKMHHKQKHNGTCFFAYNPGQDEKIAKAGGGGGETLTHYLFKTAISELNTTELRINKWNDQIQINIKKAWVEHKIIHDGKSYWLDVYLEFDSESLLGVKWGRKLGIEVHYTNKVEEKYKHHVVNALEIPTVEIDISKKFKYLVDDQYSTPEKERKYIEFIKSRLTDYMKVKVLSDPSTKEYLQIENRGLKEKLKDQSKLLEEAKAKINDLSFQNDKYISDNKQLIKQVKLLQKYKSEIQISLDKIQSMGLFRFIIFKIFKR